MFNKNDGKSPYNHGVLVLIIAGLLSLILIVLVFKTGLIIGGMHSCTSFSDDNFKKFHSFETKKDSNWDKSTYASYKVVASLTGSGFIMKDRDGKESVVVVVQQAKIIKGKEVIDNVKVGDKVYVDGFLDEDGQLQAKLVKVYDGSLNSSKGESCVNKKRNS